MTAKFFGEFLIEKGIISNDNLVEVLVEQIAATPPLCQLVFDKKILPPSSIFSAFRYQQENQVEFMQACKALGLWTGEVQEKTNRYLEEIRKPLGQLLVKKGYIDLKKLTKMLDEFLSQMSMEPQLKVEPQQLPPVVEMAPVEPAPVQARPVMIAEPEFQPGILMELDETFDEKKRKIVRVAISLARDNAGTDAAVCKKLFQDVYKIVHSLNGLLSLLALERLSEILSAMENYLGVAQSKLSSASKEEIVRDCDLLIKAIEMAWALRVSIITHATENAFLYEDNNQAQFDELKAALNEGA